MIDKEIIECKNGQCSFDITGKQFFLQKWYHCVTCFPSDPNKGCCESCKSICHKDHHIEDRGMQHCFCDCGSGDCPIICKCKANQKIDLNGQSGSEKLNITTNNHEEEQTNKISIEAYTITNDKNVCKITKNESSLFLRSLKNPNQNNKSKGKDKTKRKPFHLYV